MPDVQPLRYSPSFESVDADEDAVAADIVRTMLEIQRKTRDDGFGALRPVHAKAHALLRGELEVLPDLPPELAQGLFAVPARYAAALRLSTIPGDLLDDGVSLPRGLAIKLFDVPGERLPGSHGQTTQDFVLVDGQTFIASDGHAFARSLKLLAATTDRGERAKKLLSTVLRGVEAVVDGLGGDSAALRGLGGQPMTHPLGDRYYSQTPFLYGQHMAKFAVFPASHSLAALAGAPLPHAGERDALRAAVSDFFGVVGAEWEFRVQLCTDLETMPIEDAAVPWPDDRSPWRTVAKLRVPPQPSWNEERVREIDQGTGFSPWHGLAAHRPLGALNRLRQPAYAEAQRGRGLGGGCPVVAASSPAAKRSPAP